MIQIYLGHYHETIAEALQGTELEFSGLQIDFKASTGSHLKYQCELPLTNCDYRCVQESVGKTEYCKITLNDANLKAFLYAVKNHYWYQMYLGRNAFDVHSLHKDGNFI
jgi:transmembrane 9 superfamily protein 3